MPRTRLLAALALTAALALPAAAEAAPRATAKAPTTASVLRDAAAVSARYWRTTPCQGKVKATTRQAVVLGLTADSDAWVTFDSPLGANDLAAPASSYSNCTIGYARWRWPTAASMVEDWDLLCATTIHEMGHLLGHVHDATPGSVMAPLFARPSDLPSICRTSRPAR